MTAARPRVLQSHLRATPALPPLLFRHTATLAWLMGIAAARWPAPACVCCLVLLWVDSRCRRPATALLIIAAFALGLCATHLSLPHKPYPPATWEMSSTQKVRITGRIANVQGMPGGRLRILLEDAHPIDTDISIAHNHATATRSLLWTWENAPYRPLPGQHATVTLRLRSTAGFANTALPDYGATWAARGVFLRAWSQGIRGDPVISGTPAPTAALREELRQRVLLALQATADSDNQISTQAAAFLPALLFGDRAMFSAATIEMLSTASLLHSIALSGQHLAFMAMLGLALAYAMGYGRPSVYLVCPRSLLALTLTLPLALCYLWLGDAPPSLIRASCMLALLALWTWRGGRNIALDILLDALLVITLCHPTALYDIGLQLSALAVGALACSLPLLRAARAVAARHLCGKRYCPIPAHLSLPLRLTLGALDIALCSAAISLALLPPSLFYFHNTGWWFLLNVLWLPVLGIWVLPCAFAGIAFLACGLSSLGCWALCVAKIPCLLLLHGLIILQEQGWLHMPALPHPHWLFWLAWCCLLLVVCLRAQRASLPPAGRRLLVAGLICIVAWIYTLPCWRTDIRCALLDVGQGQAVLLETPQWRLLVDAGNGPQFGVGNARPQFDFGSAIVIPRLSYNALPTLNAVFASHPDMDHIGGLFSVLRQCSIGIVLHNGELPTAGLAEQWRKLRDQHNHCRLTAGNSIDLGKDLTLEVLHPPHAWDRKGNNASLVLRLTQGGKGLLLLTGDIERPAIAAMLASGVDLRAQIVIAPHHGADSSFSPALYDAARPDVVLASCAAGGRWSYPGKKLQKFLEERGIPLLTTAARGEIDVLWEERQWQLTYARSPIMEGIAPHRLDTWLSIDE